MTVRFWPQCGQKVICRPGGSAPPQNRHGSPPAATATVRVWLVDPRRGVTVADVTSVCVGVAPGSLTELVPDAVMR